MRAKKKAPEQSGAFFSLLSWSANAGHPDDAAALFAE
jgi:hypothetical protein